MTPLGTTVIIEDDPTIANAVEAMLKVDGFKRIRKESCGDEGLRTVRETKASLVILDLMLPHLDGLTVCRLIREDAGLAETKIVMLTAKTEDRDVARGLDLGADDYVTKPFSRQVLLARIHALFRRNTSPVLQGKSFRGLTIIVESCLAFVDGVELQLSKSEFGILQLLVSHPDRVYTRQQIINAIQQDDSKSVSERTVDVQIVGLRRKLGDWADNIETVWGIGYRVRA